MFAHEPNGDKMWNNTSSTRHAVAQESQLSTRRIPQCNKSVTTTFLTFLWLLLLARVIPAATVDVTEAPSPSSSPSSLCACQPAVYEIALDFNISCDDQTVAAGTSSNPGINDTACLVLKETVDQNVTDFTPVTIHTIQFIEHNELVNPIQQVPLVGEFGNGDIVTYTSVLANQTTNNFTESTIPRTLQVILRGNNAEDQNIQLIWFIRYNASCEIAPPLIVPGQTMGWSEFVSTSQEHYY
jgi:hypothetical protein